MVNSETQGRETDSLNVYLLPDSFTCRHEIKAVRYIVRTVTTRDWNKLFTRLIEHHNEAFGRGVWCIGALNPSPHSWILTFVSEDSSPRFYLFTSSTIRMAVHTAAPKCVSKPIRYIWRSTFVIGEGQAPSVAEKAPNLPFLCVNRNPIYPRVWCSCRSNREEKSLRHVVMVAKFLDDSKPLNLT